MHASWRCLHAGLPGSVGGSKVRVAARAVEHSGYPEVVGGDDPIVQWTPLEKFGRAVDCCTARWRGILSATRSSTPLKVLIPQQLTTLQF